MRLVADTSVIIAAILESEPRHVESNRVLTQATHVFLTPHVSAEVYYLLAAAGYHQAAQCFLSDISGGFYELVNPDAADYEVAKELIQHYEGKTHRKKPKSGSLDMADAMNVIAAARQETTMIATLDQDYRIVKPLSGPAYFTLVPDDSVSPGIATY